MRQVFTAENLSRKLCETSAASAAKSGLRLLEPIGSLEDSRCGSELEATWGSGRGQGPVDGVEGERL